jgi:ribosomal protein S18 acetylase RimI-like enzyme
LLRVGRLGDLGELVRLEAACFDEGRFHRGQLRWILRNANALTLVEDMGRDLAGAVMLLFESRACRVLSVAVVPPLRRRGLATSMMMAAERIARERGCMTIRLEVSTRNVAAIELYRTLGYKVDGLLPRYYSWGDDAHSMRKPLGPPEEAATPTGATQVSF